MRKYSICFFLVLLFAVGVFVICPGGLHARKPGPAFQKPKPLTLTNRPAFKPGEILVTFREGVPESQARAVHAQKKHAVLKALAPRLRRKTLIHSVRLKLGQSMQDVLQDYRKNPLVAHAQPNFIYRVCAAPDDTSYSFLWGLHNTGQSVNGTAGTADADIDAPEAWDIATGNAQVIVAVSDTGLSLTHPDLQANIWVNTDETDGDGIDNDGNGYVDDRYGWDFFDNDNDPTDYHSHGTHVAGTIGALGNNATGVTGVNWLVQLMPIKIGGVEGFGDTAGVVEGIAYAVANGAKVINASWGAAGAEDTLVRGAIQSAGAAGVVFVAAAGNSGWNNDVIPFYPAGYDLDNIIAVAASDQNDDLASFSNYGANGVDVAAPGVNIYSSYPQLSAGASQTIYSTGFESQATGQTPSGWTKSGSNSLVNAWSVGTDRAFSGAKSLEDSPGRDYASLTNSYIWLNEVQSKDCEYEVQFRVLYDLEDNVDYFYFASSFDKVSVGYSLREFTGSSSDAYEYVMSSGTLLTELFEMGYAMGFGLYSDFSATDKGVSVDEVRFVRVPVSVSSLTYDYSDGTSMAAPHVAGLAGLLMSMLPNASAGSIKQLIMSGVDVKASLTGKVVSNGRINAFSSVQAAQPYVLSAPNLSAVTVLGVSSVSWSWSNVANEAGFRVRQASDGASLSGDLPADTLTYTQTSLPGNSLVQGYVQAFNDHNFMNSGNSSALYTLAGAPSSTTVDVHITSVTISWAGNSNTSGTVYHVESSLDDVVYTSFFSGTETSVTHTGLTSGSTHYYRVRAENGAHVMTAYDASVQAIAPVTETTHDVPPSGGTVSFQPVDREVSLHFPSGTFSQTVTVDLDYPIVFPPLHSHVYRLKGTGVGIDITLSPSLQPGETVTLVLGYQDSDTAGKNESNFVVARYNENSGFWEVLPSSVDTSQNRVTAGARDLTLFQVVELAPSDSVSSVKVFPNPFRPALGHTYMNLMDLPPNAQVRIYSLKGELIRELWSGSAGMVQWDVKNDSGDNVGSGVYFCLAECSGTHKVMKIMVQR